MDATTDRRKLGIAALALALGALVWFGTVLFEEFVTADLRWSLWFGSAALFACAALLARRGGDWWTVPLLAAPLVVLYGRLVVAGMAVLWPHPALWAAAPCVGFLLARRGGALAVGASVLLCAALLGYGAWYVPSVIAAELNDYVDEAAPEFALQRLDGTPYPMHELAGKVVVLDFFATWCPPCVAEVAELARMKRELSPAGDAVILIVGWGAGGESREQVANWAEQRGYDLPFAYDPDGAAHAAFEFSNVPALAVLDPHGRVRLRRVGFNPAETGFRRDLAELIDRLGGGAD